MTTVGKQVAAGSDDCEENNDTWIDLTTNFAYLGYYDSTSASYDMGLRWQSISIPQGTAITSATLSIYLTGVTGTLAANIRGIDEDNTATWSSGSRPSQRTKTTATINASQGNWSNYNQWNWASISITSVIQEIINRAGWNSNNAVGVVIENTGAGTNYSTVRTYEYTGNLYGAALSINYPGGTMNARPSMNVHPGVMFGTLTSGHGY